MLSVACCVFCMVHAVCCILSFLHVACCPLHVVRVSHCMPSAAGLTLFGACHLLHGVCSACCTLSHPVRFA
jgi:hypothetical protein